MTEEIHSSRSGEAGEGNRPAVSSLRRFRIILLAFILTYAQESGSSRLELFVARRVLSPNVTKYVCTV